MGSGIRVPGIFANIASFTLPVAARWRCLWRSNGGRGWRRHRPHRKGVRDSKSGRRPRHRRHAVGRRFVGAKKFVASAIGLSAARSRCREDLFPEPVREKAKAWHWGNHSLVTTASRAEKSAGLSATLRS